MSLSSLRLGSWKWTENERRDARETAPLVKMCAESMRLCFPGDDPGDCNEMSLMSNYLTFLMVGGLVSALSFLDEDGGSGYLPPGGDF